MDGRSCQRTKQFKSSTRPSNQPTETSLTRFNGSVDDIPLSRSNHVRHQPDELRGAMLVAIVVVTIVLYLVLWELERTSFTSVPKPNLTWNTVTATLPSSGNSQIASAQYPPATVHWQEGPGEGSNLADDRIPPSKPGRMTRIAWPPLVTRVPEEHTTQDLAEEFVDRTDKNEITHPSSFDSAYCHGACRFLLPARVGEQESKARVHFMQLRMLARRLNRTIVLPNVGNSRMSACSQWPFDAYYDTSGFMHERDSPDSRVAIDLDEFSKWVDERPEPPNSFVISMQSIHLDRRDRPGAQSDSQDVPFIVGKAEVDPNIVSCLESKLARLRSSLSETALSISFDPGPLKTESEYASTRLAQLLSNGLDLDANIELDMMMEPAHEYTPRPQYANSSYLSLADVDVLILNYDLRHPLFPAMHSHFSLHYAPALYDLADRLSDNLGPFLGVHWRMENVPAQNLAWCAASLVSTLHALLQHDVTGESVRHVWLATDHARPLGSFTDVVRVPADDDRMSDGIGNGSGEDPGGSSLSNYGPLRKSSTFKALSLEHDDAIGILTEAFQSGGDLEAWKLTDLAEQLRRYPYVEGKFEVNEALLNDSGVFGILDKLVIVQAKMFVSGSADCSKTR
ncbi:hypothetical protein V8E55_004105 [Tylopilus felleus]